MKHKLLLTSLILVIILISGCANKTFNEKIYGKITFEELESASCKTIREWYNECDNEGIIIWKQDCRGKFLPYILECIENDKKNT